VTQNRGCVRGSPATRIWGEKGGRRLWTSPGPAPDELRPAPTETTRRSPASASGRGVLVLPGDPADVGSVEAAGDEDADRGHTGDAHRFGVGVD